VPDAREITARGPDSRPLPPTPEHRGTTDSIPRARIEQILEVLARLAESARPLKFEDVRTELLRQSHRAAPSASEAMWTVARDILGDLNKLGLARVGPLPRRRSEVTGLRETPCEATPPGVEIGKLFRDKPGQAHDRLLREWVLGHFYFRTLLSRLERAPLFVPDITSIKYLGAEGVSQILLDKLGDRVVESLTSRVRVAGWDELQITKLTDIVRHRVVGLRERTDLAGADTKTLVDAVQDGVVLPAVLQVEDLPFDPVTFQHLLKASQGFLVAAWTSSHPQYTGRVIFSTCDFRPDGVLEKDKRAADLEVNYHGRTYATERFAASLVTAWRRVTENRGGYADAYVLRALVCVDIGIAPQVFDVCMERTRDNPAGFELFTELPFAPPPPGEDYVKLGNKRIGLIKLSMREGN
jgi:hypothetical protein